MPSKAPGGAPSLYAALAFADASNLSFTVAGAPIAQNAALIDASFDLRLSQRARLGLSYYGQLAADAQQNAVRGDFSWRLPGRPYHSTAGSPSLAISARRRRVASVVPSGSASVGKKPLSTISMVRGGGRACSQSRQT